MHRSTLRCESWLLPLAVVLAVAVAGSSARSLYAELADVKRADAAQCPVYANEAMHAVFDRICDMCHEMFKSEMPNLRAECRSNCFKNPQFKLCLAQYSPGTGGGLSLPPVRRSSNFFY